MKITEIDILVNAEYYLYLPANGIDLILVRNEFDLLTNDIASARPMYITQQFSIPLDKNIDIFNKLKGSKKTFQILYNRIPVLTGSLVEFSIDQQQRSMIVSVSSKFKDVVDFMGNNILYLDNIDLSKYNMNVPTGWGSENDNFILRWGYYNPVDTNNGSLEYNASNVYSYCKPSFNILNYIRANFDQAGWDLDDTNLPSELATKVIAPSTAYQVTSFLVQVKEKKLSIQPRSSVVIPFKASDLKQNIGGLQAHTVYPSIQMGENFNSIYPVKTFHFNDNNNVVYNEATQISALNGASEATIRQYEHFYIQKSMYWQIGVMIKANKKNKIAVYISYQGNTEREYVYTGFVDVNAGEWQFMSFIGSTFATNQDMIRFELAMNNGEASSIDDKLYLESRGLYCTWSSTNTFSYMQMRYPNRLQTLKIKGNVSGSDIFDINLRETNNNTPLLTYQYLGEANGIVNLVSDAINTNEGISPIYIEVVNNNDSAIEVDINDLSLYNLFSIYETNQDSYITPESFYYSVADNQPKIVGVNLYREMLMLYQIAQKSDDILQQVSYYSVNDIFKKNIYQDINRQMFWNGYISLGDSIEGLGKYNIIRYNNDAKRQKAFIIDLPQLPSNMIYFESEFKHGELNNKWKALTCPDLNYKVKLVDNISIEYLEYKNNGMYLGDYISYKPFIFQEIALGDWCYFSLNGIVYPIPVATVVTCFTKEGDNIGQYVYQTDVDVSLLQEVINRCEGNIDGINIIMVNYNMLASGAAVPDYWIDFCKKYGINENWDVIKNNHTIMMFISNGIDGIQLETDNQKAIVVSNNQHYIAQGQINIPGRLTFNGLSINDLTKKYWDKLIQFLGSSKLQTPNIFKAEMRISYYEYLKDYSQDSLFFYKNNAIMIRAQYNVLNQTLEATFVSIQ